MSVSLTVHDPLSPHTQLTARALLRHGTDGEQLDDEHLAALDEHLALLAHVGLAAEEARRQRREVAVVLQEGLELLKDWGGGAATRVSTCTRQPVGHFGALSPLGYSA
jgi:hypothetical protein